MRTVRKVATGALTGVLAALFLLYWMRAPYVVAIGAAAVLAFCVLAIKTSSDDVPARTADEAWLAAAPDLPPASERRSMEQHQAGVQSPRRRPVPTTVAAGPTVASKTADAPPLHASAGRDAVSRS